MSSTSKSSIDHLRKRAEKAIAEGLSQDHTSFSNIKDYIHELRVYQVELEMQADELQHTQTDLQESRDEYSELYDHAPIGYISINYSGVILKTNATFADMIHVRQEALEYKPLSRFIQKKDRPLFFTICQKALDSEQFRTGEIGFKSQNGTLFFGRLDITPHEAGAGMEAHYRVTVVDVTAQKQAEQEKIRLETEILKHQKDDSLKRLAGGIAHNFNNLLAIIMGNIELIQETKPSREQIDRSLSDAYRASNKAATLSKMMLTYLGYPSTTTQSIDLIASLDTILSVIQSTLHGLLHLSYNPDPVPIEIECDPAQLAQIIDNLIDNSVEAIGPDPGKITVSVYQNIFSPRDTPHSYHGQQIKTGHYACIEIEDTGCGMDSRTLEKAVDPFFTTNFIGRGLGLSAVWGIVQAHKGYFFLDSKQGKGTVAKIYLPIAKQDLPLLEQEKPKAPHPPLELLGKTVLYVDDDQLVREIGRLLLEDKGISVLEAEGGKEAVQIYEKHKDDITCVVLDYAMPDQDGNLTLVELRKITPNLPVLLVSGFHKEQAVNKFMTEKPNEFLQKPFSRDEFVHAIEELFIGTK